MKDLIDYFDKKLNIKTTKNEIKTIKLERLNKGTGAGGVNTNKSGKNYEENVDCSKYLLCNGFVAVIESKNSYLSKTVHNTQILFFKQRELNKYLNRKFSKQIFRIPDHAILVLDENNKPHLTIIEIKNQNVSGSVDEKLWAGVAIKKNYQYWLRDFKIDYVFILSTFLYNLVELNNKKYTGLKHILQSENILYFHGNSKTHNIDMYKLIMDRVINNS